MKKTIWACVVSIFLFACSTSKTTSGNTTGVTDGSSYANAVLIYERSEGKGIAKEYEWLKAHYPGHAVVSQALNNNKGVPYDIITITTSDGTQKKVYFDISKFFGKL